MLRRIVGGLLGLALIVACSQVDRMGAIARVTAGTVMLYADVGLGETDVCSGWVLRSEGRYSLIATARHCTLLPLTRVKFHDGDIGTVLDKRHAAEADTGIITVRSQHPHDALQTTRDLTAGEPLFTIGDPSGDAWSFNSGFSRNGALVHNEPGFGSTLSIEGPGIWHGDSGAPVCNESGVVVGTVDGGGDPEYPTVIYIAPIADTLGLLAQV